MNTTTVSEEREKLKRFYETSSDYKKLLDAHNKEYLKSYVDIVNKYAKPQSKILDLGCGNGLSSYMLSEYGHQVIGTDISEVMLYNARQRLGNRDNVVLVATDGYTLPFPDNSMDLIFSYIVFQHMKSVSIIENNFKEAHRILKSGGIFKVLCSYVKYKSMYFWWSGVSFSDNMISDYKIIKRELTPDNRVWLWLEK